MSKKQYLKQLDELLDEIYHQASIIFDRDDYWSYQDLADASGLALNTVYLIGNRITREPRFSTIQKLAQAVGMTLTLRGHMIQKRSA